jgi:hypothetical protein
MDGLYIGFDNPNIKTIWPESEVGARANRVCSIPAGRSRFAHFFEPIYPLMRDYFWLAHGWESSPFVDLIFESGGEELLDSYRLEHPRFDITNASLFRPGTLPTLANYLCDDWIDLLGFIPGPADAGEGQIADELFDATCGDDKYYTAIERRVTLCFFCVDGFSWEVYCQDRAAVTQVFESIKLMEGVEPVRGGLRGRKDRFGFSYGHFPE